MKSSGFFHFFFKNISSRLKTVAKVVLVCGTLLGVALAVVLFIKAADFGDTRGILSGVGDKVSEEYVKIAFACLLGIPIVSYLTALALYGIGVACENTARAEGHLPAHLAGKAHGAQPADAVYCARCGGRMNPGADFCIHCGTKRTR